jgi:putative DNA primase/helicase
MEIQEIVTLLGGGVKSGRNWLVRCPAHGDRSPSLSIRKGREGRVLVHCFAGCSYAEIQTQLERLNIKLNGDRDDKR